MTKLLRGMHNFFIKTLYELIANFARSKRFRDEVQFAIDCMHLNLNPNRLSICRESKILPCTHYAGSKFWVLLQEPRVL